MTTIVTTFAPRIKGNLRQYLDQVAKNAAAGEKRLKQLSKRASEFKFRQYQLGARSLRRMGTEARKANIHLKNLGLTGAGRGGIGGFSAGLQKLAQTVYRLTAAYIAFRTVARGVNAILQQFDMWTGLINRLRLVTNNMAHLRKTMGDLRNMSIKLRTDLSAMVVLYQRVDRAIEKLGYSSRDTLGVVEAVSLAVKTSGTTAHEATGGIRQLTQAFNKGKLDGDEFRSVAENMPVVLDAIAASMSKVYGELQRTDLFALAPKGLITVDFIVEGLLAALPQLRKEFGKFSPLISEKHQTLGNVLTAFFGALDRWVKASGGWNWLIDGMISQLDEWAKGLNEVKDTAEKNINLEQYKKLGREIEDLHKKILDMRTDYDKLDPNSIPAMNLRMDIGLAGIRLSKLRAEREKLHKDLYGSTKGRGRTRKQRETAGEELVSSIRGDIGIIEVADKLAAELGRDRKAESQKAYRDLLKKLEKGLFSPQIAQELHKTAKTAKQEQRQIDVVANLTDLERKIKERIDPDFEANQAKLKRGRAEFRKLTDDTWEHIKKIQGGWYDSVLEEEKVTLRLTKKRDELLFRYRDELKTDQELIKAKDALLWANRSNIDAIKGHIEYLKKEKALREGVGSLFERFRNLIGGRQRRLEAFRAEKGLPRRTTVTPSPGTTVTPAPGTTVTPAPGTEHGASIEKTSMEFHPGRDRVKRMAFIFERIIETYGKKLGEELLQRTDVVEYLNLYEQWLSKGTTQTMKMKDRPAFDDMMERWREGFERQWGKPPDKVPEQKRREGAPQLLSQAGGRSRVMLVEYDEIADLERFLKSLPDKIKKKTLAELIEDMGPDDIKDPKAKDLAKGAWQDLKRGVKRRLDPTRKDQFSRAPGGRLTPEERAWRGFKSEKITPKTQALRKGIHETMDTVTGRKAKWWWQDKMFLRKESGMAHTMKDIWKNEIVKDFKKVWKYLQGALAGKAPGSGLIPRTLVSPGALTIEKIIELLSKVTAYGDDHPTKRRDERVPPWHNVPEGKSIHPYYRRPFGERDDPTYLGPGGRSAIRRTSLEAGQGGQFRLAHHIEKLDKETLDLIREREESRKRNAELESQNKVSPERRQQYFEDWQREMSGYPEFQVGGRGGGVLEDELEQANKKATAKGVKKGIEEGAKDIEYEVTYQMELGTKEGVKKGLKGVDELGNVFDFKKFIESGGKATRERATEYLGVSGDTDQLLRGMSGLTQGQQLEFITGELDHIKGLQKFFDDFATSNKDMITTSEDASHNLSLFGKILEEEAKRLGLIKDKLEEIDWGKFFKGLGKQLMSTAWESGRDQFLEYEEEIGGKKYKMGAGGGPAGATGSQFFKSISEGKGVKEAALDAGAVAANEAMKMIMNNAPEFEKSFGKFLRVLNEGFAIIASFVIPILEGLAPVLDAVSTLFAGVMDTLRGLEPAFKVLGEIIKWVGEALKWLVDGMMTTLQWLDENVGGGTRAISGGVMGALAGAAIGTLIAPGFGTAIGAGIGGGVGFWSGMTQDAGNRTSADLKGIPTKEEDPILRQIEINTRPQENIALLKAIHEAMIRDYEEELRIRAQASRDVHLIREVGTVSESIERGQTIDSSPHITIINVDDGSQVAKHMAGKKGEEIVMNHLYKNGPESGQVVND